MFIRFHGFWSSGKEIPVLPDDKCRIGPCLSCRLLQVAQQDIEEKPKRFRCPHCNSIWIVGLFWLVELSCVSFDTVPEDLFCVDRGKFSSKRNKISKQQTQQTQNQSSRRNISSKPRKISTNRCAKGTKPTKRRKTEAKNLKKLQQPIKSTLTKMRQIILVPKDFPPWRQAPSLWCIVGPQRLPSLLPGRN